MSSISHLVWHDVRALRLPLLAWVLVLLAQAAVMAIGPGLLDPEARRGVHLLLADFLAGTRLAFTILLTVLLVQRDSPVGTTAFWLTRPIPPAALAASKLCSAGLLLIVLPAVVGWMLFAALGLPQGDVLSGVWQLVIEQAMIVSLSAVGGSITATIPQFAVVAVASVLLIGVLVNEAKTHIDMILTGWVPAGVTPLGAWAFVTVIGTTAVIGYQYTRRHTVRTAAGATAVLVVGVLTALSARPAFEAVSTKPLQAGVLDTNSITLGVDESAVRVESGSTSVSQGRAVRYRYAEAMLRVSGAPPALVFQPRSVASTWHPAGAAPVHWQRRQRAAYRRTVQRAPDSDGQPLASLAEALGEIALLKPLRMEPSAFSTTLLSLPEAQVFGLPSTEGRLEATVELSAWRYRVTDAAPLTTGSTVLARLGRLTVRAIAATRGGVQVDLQGAVVQRVWLTSEDLFGSGGINSAEFLALRNASRRQAVLVARESTRRFSYSSALGLSNALMVTEVRRLEFIAPPAGEESATLDDAWLSGAELVVLRPEDLGVFSKSLRIENVKMGIETQGPGGGR
jgi:hypothetical protein